MFVIRQQTSNSNVRLNLRSNCSVRYMCTSINWVSSFIHHACISLRFSLLFSSVFKLLHIWSLVQHYSHIYTWSDSFFSFSLFFLSPSRFFLHIQKIYIYLYIQSMVTLFLSLFLSFDQTVLLPFPSLLIELWSTYASAA